MKYYVADAFAEKVFEGNPAGVCVMEEWLDDGLMQKIAMENNLSETAFTVKEDNTYKLRWFTPGGEIDLCGHATLATAFILARFYEPDAKTFHFTTMTAGDLVVNKKGELFELDFPSRMPDPINLTAKMVEALGKEPVEAYISRDLMFVYDNEDDVINTKIDVSKVKELPEGVGLIITAPSNAGRDFVCRCFYPKLNVAEDPVTGSAHCNLIPYWAKRLGKAEIVSKQVSPRGGMLYCRDAGNRVFMAGKGALYAEAEIYF
ncbi:MAG: PhzF family phenazine biosynthesis protein [Eubacteriales bacterium]|nr:PhzF family phenazine biosynthesis protein [Eubacteriales bacterium]MDD4390408.1 PhzF family phenazine biosynthesis protein [Eubacteriales bacterium]